MFIKKVPTRIYKLYSLGPGPNMVYTNYNKFLVKPWIFEVKARSIKQAYWLLANQQVADQLNGGVGIVSVDHADGPDALTRWRFDFDIAEIHNKLEKE